MKNQKSYHTAHIKGDYYTVILEGKKEFSPDEYVYLKGQGILYLMPIGGNSYMHNIKGVALPAIDEKPSQSEAWLYSMYRAYGLDLYVDTGDETQSPQNCSNHMFVVDGHYLNEVREVNKEDKFSFACLSRPPFDNVVIAVNKQEEPNG